MGAPRHLWSGDWRRESEAAARERAARRGSAPAIDVAESAGERAADETAGTREHPTSEQATREQGARQQVPEVERARARERPPQGAPADARWRALLGFALVAVAVAGGAVVARAIIDGQSSPGAPPPAISTGQTPTAVAGQAWLGVETQAIPGGGAFVSSVVSGGPADDAGIQEGDLIAAINGQPISGPASISTLLNRMSAGDQVTIAIERGGQLLQLQLTLGSRPGGFP